MGKIKNISLLAAAAIICALAFTSCETDADTDDIDYSSLYPVDHSVRQYNVILPEANSKGSLSVSPNPARAGAAVSVKYLPPETPETVEEIAQTDENIQPYIITALTGTYNNGQKTLNIIKNSGGGGGMEVLHARHGCKFKR
ncbi:MAG: hypothetical protein LBJ35_01045 [Spirochaetaceae bacterium]|jgi:hypothetical protein|nr:hypothetical protein [Spirochaetaceae bacterium]